MVGRVTSTPPGSVMMEGRPDLQDKGLCRVPRLKTDLFHFRLFARKTMSSHQQDLPDTALFCRCLSLGRVTERQFLANWDNQLAIAHGFGHELERFPVESREHVNHFYRRVFRGVLRHLYNRCIDSSWLNLGDQLLGG